MCPKSPVIAATPRISDLRIKLTITLIDQARRRTPAAAGGRALHCHGESLLPVYTAATTERLGVAPEVIAQLPDCVSEAPVTDRMQPVLAYARKLTLTPADITQDDVDAILAAGWDETALYHTVAVTALFNFMNRLVEGLGIELSPEYVEPASKRLAEQGYLPLIDMLNR